MLILKESVIVISRSSVFVAEKLWDQLLLRRMSDFDLHRVVDDLVLVLLQLKCLLLLQKEVVAMLSQVLSLLALDILEKIIQILLYLHLLFIEDGLLKTFGQEAAKLLFLLNELFNL